ncbi:MAG: hypothetical protein MUF54_16790 [Polyangiaceae bacterium]|nr:hypothetical protein [Polyangiaceae bacterium]
MLLCGELPDALPKALGRCGLQVCRPPDVTARAIVLAAADGVPGPTMLRRARLALSRRGRVFVLSRCDNVPTLLMELSSARLEPKRLLLLHRDDRTAPHAAIVVAVAAKPGGLQIELVVASAGPPADGPA